jgi:hypothetical protein
MINFLTTSISKILILILLTFLFLGSTMSYGNRIAIKDSPSTIEEKVLQITPYGSSIDKVNELCASYKLRCKISKDSGFWKQQDGETPKGVGSSHIRAFLGDEKTSSSMITSVSVFFGFDANGRLIDVWAWKTIDAP